jgi:hypothetical protein
MPAAAIARRCLPYGSMSFRVGFQMPSRTFSILAAERAAIIRRWPSISMRASWPLTHQKKCLRKLEKSQRNGSAMRVPSANCCRSLMRAWTWSSYRWSFTILTSQTTNGVTFLMGDGGTADLNVNGAYTLGAVTETGLAGFTPTYIGNAPGQVDGFGHFPRSTRTRATQASHVGIGNCQLSSLPAWKKRQPPP